MTSSHQLNENQAKKCEKRNFVFTKLVQSVSNTLKRVDQSLDLKNLGVSCLTSLFSNQKLKIQHWKNQLNFGSLIIHTVTICWDQQDKYVA